MEMETGKEKKKARWAEHKTVYILTLEKGIEKRKGEVTVMKEN